MADKKEQVAFELENPNGVVTQASQIGYTLRNVRQVSDSNNPTPDVNESVAQTFNFEIESTTNAFNTLNSPTSISLEANKTYSISMEFGNIATEMGIKFFDSLGNAINYTFNGVSTNYKKLTPENYTGDIVLEAVAVSFGLYTSSSKINNTGTLVVSIEGEGAGTGTAGLNSGGEVSKITVHQALDAIYLALDGSEADAQTFEFEIASTSAAFNTITNSEDHTSISLQANKAYTLSMAFGNICTEMGIKFYNSLGETVYYTFNGVRTDYKKLTPETYTGEIVLEADVVSFGLYTSSSYIDNTGTLVVSIEGEGAGTVGLKSKVASLLSDILRMSGQIATANSNASAANNYINNNRNDISQATNLAKIINYESTASATDNLYDKDGDFETGNISVSNGRNVTSTNAVRMIGSFQLESGKAYNIQLSESAKPPTGHVDLRVLGYDSDNQYVGYLYAQYKYNASSPALVHIYPDTEWTSIKVTVVYWFDYFEDADLPIMIYESDDSQPVVFKDYTTEGTSLEIKNLIVDYRQIKNAPKTTQQTPSSQGTTGVVPYVSPMRTIFDKQILKIAYSVVDNSINGKINTMTHFRHCASAGYNAMKTDLHMTSDGVIVLCHDCGFCFNAGNKIKTFVAADCQWYINEHTADEVAALRHLDDDKIATLDEFLRLCKIKGITPLLTVRNSPYYGGVNDADHPSGYNGTYVTNVIAEATRLLKKYRLTENVIINCFPKPLQGKDSQEEATIIRNYLPDAHMVFMNNTTAQHGVVNESCVNFAKQTSGNNIVGAYAGADIDMFTDSAAIQMAIDNNIPLLAHTCRTQERYLELVSLGVTMFFLNSDDELDWD